jgi:ribonucleoside-diphosphate reductase alpha chain
MVKDLISMDMWNDEIRNALVANNGSVQNISGLPEEFKNLYKTVWEIS